MPGLDGLVSAASSPASPPRSPGPRVELMSLALGPMGPCIISTIMGRGPEAGRIWVEFSFLLRLLCL
jgi:hypothetical protein